MQRRYFPQPEPEQVSDDGRADGIPVRTLADVEQEHRRRMRRISELAEKQPRTDLGYHCELWRDGKRVGTYPSMAAAARAHGITPENLSSRLRENPRLAGFVWRITRPKK